jgi:hypothetical protein
LPVHLSFNLCCTSKSYRLLHSRPLFVPVVEVWYECLLCMRSLYMRYVQYWFWTSLVKVFQLCTSPIESELFLATYCDPFISNHHFWQNFAISSTIIIWYEFWTLKMGEVRLWLTENENEAIWVTICTWYRYFGRWKWQRGYIGYDGDLDPWNRNEVILIRLDQIMFSIGTWNSSNAKDSLVICSVLLFL